MFDSIARSINRPAGYDDRAQRLTVLKAVLDGTMYDGLAFEFGDEKGPDQQYVPLRQRKPSVRYNLCRLVVEDSVAMLFGAGRFPTLTSEHDDTQAGLADILDESAFSEAMLEAAQIGSTGSVAVLMRILGNRVFWTVMPTPCLTPEWDPKAPDTLLRLTERYQVQGSVLADQGYTIPPILRTSSFWFQREWDDTSETWYLPLLVADATNGKKPVVDTQNSVEHALGFVPAVWIKNLPGGGGVDGRCTFEPAIETQIEIEYRLSQGGRALQYASDPLMMIKDPAADTNGDMVRTAANALVVGKDGDAKMLQIDGAATGAVLEFVHGLREFALETVHGNRASADRLAAAQSGRAMEMLHAEQIGMVDQLRQSYGRAMLRLARMVVVAQQKFKLTAFEEVVPVMDAGKRLKLRWGPYFAPTVHDDAVETNTLSIQFKTGLISRESAVERVCHLEAIPDHAAEVERIQSDIAAEDKRLLNQPGVQTKASEIVTQ